MAIEAESSYRMLFYGQMLLNNEIEDENNVEWIDYIMQSIDKESEDAMFLYIIK